MTKVKMLKNEHLQSTMIKISKSVALKQGFLLLLFIIIWFEKSGGLGITLPSALT